MKKISMLFHLVQRALERYLSEDAGERARREIAYALFCERPMRLAPDELKVLLKLDSWSR